MTRVHVHKRRWLPALVIVYVVGTLIPAQATAVASARVVGHSVHHNELSPTATVPAPIHWWKGDGNANDSSGTANGTLLGGGAYAPGENGQAFNLDGNDDYVDIPSSAMSGVTGAISVSAWVNPSSETFNCGPTGPKCSDVILSQYDTDKVKTSFILDITQGGVLEWFVVGPSCDSSPNNHSDLREVQTKASIPLNQWSSVVATFEPSTQAMHVFINGSDSPVIHHDVGRVDRLCSTSTPVRIGSAWGGPQPGGLSDFFPGLVDDVRIYNRDVTSDFATIDPPTRHDAVAYDINNGGIVVGELAGDLGTVGFVRTPNGRFHIVDRYDAESTSVRGINDQGAIVGRYVKSVNGALKTFAFVQNSPDTAMKTLTPPTGFSDMKPSKIDNAGDIVGSFVDSNGVVRGFFRTAAAVLTRINCTTHTGAQPIYTIPLGIGNDGTVVGTFSDSIDYANGRSHGFTWSRAAPTCKRIDVPGAAVTQIWDRANGAIVGTYVPPGGVASGFAGPTGGPFTTVVYPGSALTWVLGTDNAADLVGFYNLGNNDGEHAFITAI